MTVAGEPVHRPYKDELQFPNAAHTLRIKDIEFVEFADVDGGVGAVGWIGHHDYVRSLPPALGVRGLRARYGDIQVGESNLFEDTFKEARFNGWTIGELHILDRRIVPNARRDNFEVNHHYYNLLVQLGPLAAKITQRCRSASVARNTAQIVRNIIAATAARLKERRSFDRAELSRLKSAVQRPPPRQSASRKPPCAGSLKRHSSDWRKGSRKSPQKGARRRVALMKLRACRKTRNEPGTGPKIIHRLRHLCK